MVGGAADTLGLCFALSGLAVAGPLRLILQPLLRGDAAWSLLVGGGLLFLLTGILVAMQRHRLVLYNCTREQFQQLWPRVLSTLGGESRGVGSVYLFPSLGVALRVETFALLRNVTLVVEPRQSAPGWKALERYLLEELARLDAQPRRAAVSRALAGVGLALVLSPMWWLLADPSHTALVRQWLGWSAP